MEGREALTSQSLLPATLSRLTNSPLVYIFATHARSCIVSTDSCIYVYVGRDHAPRLLHTMRFPPIAGPSKAVKSDTEVDAMM